MIGFEKNQFLFTRTGFVRAYKAKLCTANTAQPAANCDWFWQSFALQERNFVGKFVRIWSCRAKQKHGSGPDLKTRISLLLIGFLSGNLFGTVLSFARGFVTWDGFIIAGLLVAIEGTSYMAYKPQQHKPLLASYFTAKAINFFKVGVMIGFFVDAFKVGS